MATAKDRVRNRQSPGGVIWCDGCGTIVSRRRFNNALRFAQTPACRCGSTALTIDSPYEIRDRRLVWVPRVKTRTRTVQGSNRSVRR